MTIDEAIEHAREVAKNKIKEMQCKTCKLFVKSDLHPLQGYCRKNEFRSIEIDSWRKVCNEYVPKEMCKCAEEHEQLAEWLEDYKQIKMLIPIEQAMKNEYNKAIDDFVEKFIFKAACEGCSGCCNCYENDGRYECEDYKEYMKIAEQLKAGERE